MKSLKAKLIVLLITMLLFTLIPFSSVAAAEEQPTDEGLQVQLIGTDDNSDGTVDNIVVYVEGLEGTEFDYALSIANAGEMDKNYINSVQDDKGNQVALIAAGDLTGENNYLYIRENNTEKSVQLNVDVNNMFTQDKMALVENTTKRIATEESKEEEPLGTRNEVIDGITYTYTVGGLKITDDQNATYSYVMVNVSSDADYNELQSLANTLNDNSKSMYEKIEIANNFYNKYNELIDNANTENSWQEVKDMQILQNEDYANQEQYVVLLKKVAEDGTTTYDAKFMTTQNRGTEEIIPASTEQVSHQETSKLPITGDSIVLFVVLAALVIIAIVVFIRMKKLNKKADK